MGRISNHLKVFALAVIFGMAAYGVVWLGILLHRAIIS